MHLFKFMFFWERRGKGTLAGGRGEGRGELQQEEGEEREGGNSSRRREGNSSRRRERRGKGTPAGGGRGEGRELWQEREGKRRNFSERREGDKLWLKEEEVDWEKELSAGMSACID